MFGFGKKKKPAQELAHMFIYESFNSIMEFLYFVGRNITGFFENNNKNRLQEFLNENGFNGKERIEFTFAYVLAASKIFIENNKNDNGKKIHSSCFDIINEKVKNSDLDINIISANEELDKIIKSNTKFLKSGELFSKINNFDQETLYYQISSYLLNNHLDKNSSTYEICNKNKNEYHISLYNCLNTTHNVSDVIFKNFNVY